MKLSICYRLLFLSLLAFCFSMTTVADALNLSAFAPITSGYGANGSFSVAVERFANPQWSNGEVLVFRPVQARSAVPVIFFAPGFSKNNPETYGALIEHIVSRGYAVVFSPYQVISGDPTLHERRYSTIFAGYEEAVRRFPRYLDTTRIGFMGHSYGAGAVPAMAWKAIVERGWGTQHAFLFPMAPWYYFNMNLRHFTSFPSHVKLLMQVYEGDDLCDHRVAKEMFDRFNLPGSEKEFVMLMTEERPGYRLGAEHGSMYGGDGDEVVDALDYYGVWRLFDALADYTFTGNEQAKRIALGNGNSQQRFMGYWADGKPVRELVAGDCVNISRSSFSFRFPYFPGDVDGATSVSSASFRNHYGIAPESLATVVGKDLSASVAGIDSRGPQLRLNGTAVRVKDSFCIEREAPLFYVSPGQVNYLVPAGTAPGPATVTVFNEKGALSSGMVQINEVAPSLFTANADGQGVAAALVLRIRADGTQQYEPVARYDTAQKKFMAVPIEFGPESDQLFLVLYGTGIRYRSSLNYTATWIGNVLTETLYAGPQGALTGLDQVNLRLPRSLAGRGEVDVLLTMDGRNANFVRVSFK